MEDWEEEREIVKVDISQLKDQVGQILEALKAMKTAGETSSSKAEDNAHPPVHNVVGTQFTFPMYGLPPGYTPPIGDHSEAEHTSLASPITNSVLPINTQGPILTKEMKMNETIKSPYTVVAHDVSTKATIHTGTKEEKSKLEALEDRMKAIEGIESYGFGDVARLSLAPRVTIPHKFKVPEFEKYKDLANAFVRQYKYNMHVASDRLQLHHMSKKEEESFKEYAQRWRELAAQVEPPLYDKEMVAMFVSTLQPPFYEHMIGNVSSNFADIIIIGERIEIGLKNGKITSQATTSKKFVFNSGKEKERGVHATSTILMWRGHAPTHNYRPIPSYPPYVNNTMSGSQTRPRPPGYYQPQQASNNAWGTGAGLGPDQKVGQSAHPKRNPEKNFTPIPMTYTEILPHLLKKGLAAIRPMKPLQPPYPKSFDANARCGFHGGAVGHSTEMCTSLKFKVQSLIDAGWLKFQEDKPSVEVNPLAKHGST
ncbi:uncharacterized protein LOC106766074 [Vigna radiata var. radiata]|uniref:Uncharacterized protein LOC106766074 n=1 Tax=Vigna radiata var. radiata TaxID=3916 RepID=A0A1S3UJV6_VIGRR|nr:uncharacterized protein LOC106766074 [Vigna radiata var. radiata]